MSKVPEPKWCEDCKEECISSTYIKGKIKVEKEVLLYYDLERKSWLPIEESFDDDEIEIILPEVIIQYCDNCGKVLE